jgi:phosphoglycolate phosphatase-like HAD superfamily hydrolase
MPVSPVWFDIDNTLAVFPEQITDDEALRITVLRVFDQENASYGDIQYKGKTDARIIKEILLVYGIPYTDEDVIRACMVLGKRTAETLHNQYPLLLPGVADLLRELGNRGVPIGIVSTNSMWQAEAKLRAIKLWSVVDPFISTFGHETDEAENLLYFAYQKAVRQYGTPDNCWYVGDGPSDILRLRRAPGVHALAVGTGIITTEAQMLQALRLLTNTDSHPPFTFLPNLGDTPTVIQILGIQ